MKKLFSLAITAALLSACVSSSKKSEVVGVYHRSWEHSDTVLSLNVGGDYSLTYAALEEKGIAGTQEVGIWIRTLSGVTLHPTSNRYRTEFDGLRTLTFLVVDSKAQLVSLANDGDSRKELRFEKELNQSSTAQRP